MQVELSRSEVSAVVHALGAAAKQANPHVAKEYTTLANRISRLDDVERSARMREAMAAFPGKGLGDPRPLREQFVQPDLKKYCGFESVDEPGVFCHRPVDHEGEHSQFPFSGDFQERITARGQGERLILMAHVDADQYAVRIQQGPVVEYRGLSIDRGNVTTTRAIVDSTQVDWLPVLECLLLSLSGVAKGAETIVLDLFNALDIARDIYKLLEYNHG